MEPKIRLNGFSGEWKKVKLENIYTLSAAGDLRKDLFSPTKDINHPYPIFSNSLENAGLYGYSSEYRYEKDALTITGRGTLGHAEYRTECFDAIIRLLILQPKKEICNIFVKEYINHKSPFVYESTGVPQLTIPQIKDIEIPIPPSKDEQRALATFFTSLDNKISAAEKRLASLKQVKAASLQAMFPQEGETTPKLRFKGCEGEWKKVKLGEIVRLKAGNSLSLAQLKEWGSYPCYGGNGIRTYLPFFSHDGEYNLIGRVGALCGNINYVNGKFYATEHALVVYPFDDINVRFLFYVLVFADLNKYKKGCAQPVLSASTLYNVDIIIPPSLTEQRQIASYFTSLDRQITSQSSKISKLKQIKSACLDQMFV